MKDNKKQDILIDAISGIDEDIVDKSLEKRFKLWRKKGSRTKLYLSVISAAAAVCLIFSGIIIYFIDKPNIPVYEGMTVENYIHGTLESEKLDFIPLSANYNNVGILKLLSDTTPYEIDFDEAPSSDTVPNETDMTENPSSDIAPDTGELPVFGETYYAAPNEDIYIHIHLTNPDEFEILSFTLNGVKYSSYMFEPGSNMENLILKYNVGNVSGLQEYTIDAIKYVDGEQIKDVKMKGDRTVRVFVNGSDGTLDLAPMHSFQTLTLFPKWNEAFSGEKKITSLSLYEGDTLLREISPEETVICNLPLGKRLTLKATYITEGEEKTVAHVFQTPKPSEGFVIADGKVIAPGSNTDSILYFDCDIGRNLYSNTRSQHIKEIYFSNNVKRIGDSAFVGSTGITKIVFSEGFEIIEGGTFYEGSHTLEVTLPSTLKEIGNWVFGGSSVEILNLTIYYNGTVEQWKSIKIGDLWACAAFERNITIHCTDGDIT